MNGKTIHCGKAMKAYDPRKIECGDREGLFNCIKDGQCYEQIIEHNGKFMLLKDLSKNKD